MKDIEYGKVIGLYNMILKYYPRCKTSKEKILFLVVPLNSIKKFFTLVVYLCLGSISGLTPYKLLLVQILPFKPVLSRNPGNLEIAK